MECVVCGTAGGRDEFCGDDELGESIVGLIVCNGCIETARARTEAVLGPEGSTWTSNLWRQYRLRPPGYYALIAAQMGLCALCWTPPLRARLVVDLGSATTQVRGLLHSRCRSALRLFDHSPALMVNAARYLRRDESVAEYLRSLDRFYERSDARLADLPEEDMYDAVLEEVEPPPFEDDPFV